MEIRRNIPSQNSQIGPKQVEQRAATSTDQKVKTGVENETKVKAKHIATPGIDLSEVINESSTKSKEEMSAAGVYHPKVKIISEPADKEKMQNDLKILQNELKDYQKQAKILMKENKTADYKKLFEKMNSKLTNTIKIMEQDYPGQTKIIDHLKEWRTQITKQFMMAVPQQPQEVKQHTITIE
jgi:thioester reductase-like protein